MTLNIDIKILDINPKHLIGINTMTSQTDSKTVEMWRSFMPRRREIKNALNNDLVSMQIFPGLLDFTNYDPTAVFESWAAVEVSRFEDVPEGMKVYTIQGGKYLMFTHKGVDHKFFETLGYIFNTWLPNSEYRLDKREHFEILGEKYKRNDPSSEEDVWVPIVKR